MKQHPLAWVKRVSENIQKLDEIPLFGTAPRFDWHRFSSHLASHFGLQQFHLHPKEQKWRSIPEIHQGLGGQLIVVPIHLSPLPSPLYWAMAHADREKLTAWMLNGSSQGKSFSSDVLQEGYYRFLLLEALNTAQNLDPFKHFTLQLGEEAPLPEEDAYCIDVEFSFDGKTCWGRLIVTASFRESWVYHFSAFPSEYVPTELAKKLEMVIGIKTGSVLLHQQEWSELKKGDFLLLDPGSYNPRKSEGMATLMLGPTPLFHVKIKQNKIELLDYAFTHEDTMQEQKSAPSPQKLEAPQEEAVPIRDLPIYVTVELARLKITLDQLMNLNAGNMLELPIHPDQGVSLTVNGQKVGRAELIYLGEVLGVRILEMG